MALGARRPTRVSGLLEDTCLLVVSWHLLLVRVHSAGARPGPPGWQEGAGQDASPRQQLMTQIYYLITAYRSQMVVSINSAIFRAGGVGGQSELIKLRRTLRRENTSALGSAVSPALDADVHLG